MNVSDAIRTKRAVRQFLDKPLSAEEIQHILNAGRRAQSSKNTQPWRFIAIQEKDTLLEFSKCGKFTAHLAEAALGVAILTPNPAEKATILFDAGQAAAYMQLAAWEMGIGSCLGTIYEQEPARALLGFPTDMHLNVAISFGYPIDRDYLTTPPQKGGRQPLEKLVHWEKW
jgi:nitroreductase